MYYLKYEKKHPRDLRWCPINKGVCFTFTAVFSYGGSHDEWYTLRMKLLRVCLFLPVIIQVDCT